MNGAFFNFGDIVLLVDDLRSGYGEDVICRNPKHAVDIICSKIFTGLILDNDMGDGPEGWEILKEILGKGICPQKVQLVTSNVAAKLKMKTMLRDNGYVEINEVTFIK